MYIKEHTKNILKTDIPALRSGQIVRVHQRIKDVTSKGEEKERIQIFEGQVIAVKHGRGINATITVRRIASGVGVERVFPIHAPTIAKIEIKKATSARKSKLYYTREGKEAKVKDYKKQ